MGVSGSGKSTVGRLLAAELHVPFVDGDDEHTPEAKARMAKGIPLDDAWRAPWLDRLDAILRDHETDGLVLACYHRRLTRGVARVAFVALVAPREVLAARLAGRHGHFAGPALLDSQLATLELGDDVVTVDATGPLETTAATAGLAVR